VSQRSAGSWRTFLRHYKDQILACDFLRWRRSGSRRSMCFSSSSWETDVFINVFCSEGIEIVHTPYQAPKANAFAERWVHSVREECLDKILVLTENHLHVVLKEYAQFYNSDRPHQGLGQHFPISGSTRKKMGPIRRRDVLGGVIHDYYRQPPAENHAYG
jgi:transposase InsO family protein